MRLTRDPNTDEVQVTMSHEEFGSFQTGLRTMWHFLSAETMRNIQRYGIAQNVASEANPLTGGVVPSDELSARLGALEALIGDPAWLDDQDEGTSILDLIESLFKPEPVAKRRPYQALTQRVIDAESDLQRFNAQLDEAQNQRSRMATKLKIRIDEMEQAIGQIRHAIRSLSDQGNSDRDRLNQVMGNYVTEEGFRDLIERVRRLEQANAPKAGGLFATDEEFSPPIGGIRFEKTELLASAFERGRRAAGQEYLTGAKQRVRNYMAGAFSEGTIQGVVKAIDGSR